MSELAFYALCILSGAVVGAVVGILVTLLLFS